MSEYGVRVTNPRINKGLTPVFRTDRDTLKFDIDPSKARNQFVKYTFPDNPAAPGGAGRNIYNILTFKHNLGYYPAYILYTYSYDANSPGYVFPGSYQRGGGGVSYTFASAIYQYFEAYVTETELKIDYIVENYGGGTGIPSLDVTGKSFGFKFTLYSNPLGSDA